MGDTMKPWIGGDLVVVGFDRWGSCPLGLRATELPPLAVLVRARCCE